MAILTVPVAPTLIACIAVSCSNVLLYHMLIVLHMFQLLSYIHCKKRICYFGNYIFFTRVATVDMVLWNDTIIRSPSATGNTVATGTIEFATRLGGLLRHQISAIRIAKGHCFLTKISVM